MALHVILGFQTVRNTEEPTLVYAGRSGTAARDAVDASTFEYHLILQNPLGVRKHNARAAANRAALDPEAVAERARLAEIKRLEEEKRADAIRAKAAAEAEAHIAAGAVAERAVSVVKDAIAKVATDAAGDGEDSADADDGAEHFGRRTRRQK